MDKIDNQLLIMGDAIEKLKELPDKSVDLVVTDPPYNLNKDYGKSQDKLEFDEYINFSKKWITECDRILNDNGSIYIFMGMRYI
ncbi:MAG: site-specific DNA-methyltransferase, partial [Lachnospiraceae bacterium]|nr:site-specific DNA-methyltransferase [Lachnospiraceae bacterium]